MKEQILPFILLISSLSFSQVGINTNNPNATLEIKSSSTDATKVDGVIPPILTGAQLKAKENLYTTLQTGTIVYVSEPLNPIDPNEVKTNVATIGYYYYFDGSKWIKLNLDTNIYTNNGSLNENRIVNLNNRTLTFKGTGPNGLIHERFNNTNNAPAYISLRKNNTTDLNSNSAVLQGQYLGTITFAGNTGNGYTGDPLSSNTSISAISAENFTPTSQGSSLDFFTVGRGKDTNTRRMRISSEGNVGIGTGAIDATEKLEVNGKVKINDTENLSSSSISPLFVDENGVLGTSNISLSSPLTTFITNNSIINLPTDYNTGGVLTLPLNSNLFKLNTLDLSAANNNLKIESDGIYQIAGSVNISYVTDGPTSRNFQVDDVTYTEYKPAYIFVAFNIQKSSDNGMSWTSISGARPIFNVNASGRYYYNINLPLVIESLKKDDLLKLIIYRTKGGNNIPQGMDVNISSSSSDNSYVGQNSAHGTKGYTFSISKM